MGRCEHAIAAGQGVEGMSYGKMSTLVDIVKPTVTTDEDGFRIVSDEVLATVRAYREGRHGSERWANRAAFTDATDLFRFRVVPKLTVSTDMALVCGAERFEITSVEDVKGRGMYVEVLARKVESSGKG